MSLDFPRERDCHVLLKGDCYPVVVSHGMCQAGWFGGQGVRWADSTRDEFLVDTSDGLCSGFLLWGSNEPHDNWTSLTGWQPKYGHAVFCSGTWVIATKTMELYTYSSRVAGTPVPIAYQVGDLLRFSLRGYWTNEDEWFLSGDSRSPNRFYVGSLIQTPRQGNSFYGMLKTTF